MAWLVYALIFVTLNFVVYTLGFRHFRAFSSERLIFLYQVLSFLLLPLLLLSVAPPVREIFAGLISAMSLHAIYSLSFLELWSLSEGSYSLRMVDRVERMGVMPEDTDTSDLEKIGASKKSVRLESLIGLGLARQNGAAYGPTGLGRIVAMALRFLVWLVNIRDRIG